MTEIARDDGDSRLRQRSAVSAVFLANGIAAGSWSILVPAVMRHAGIGEAEMGTIILSGGAAGIAALAMSGYLVSRYGSVPVMALAGIVLAPSLYLIQSVSSMTGAILVFMFLFGAMAFQDVAMNANGAVLEKRLPRPAMSSFHAFWSMGAMLGAGLGGFLVSWFGTAGQTLIAGSVVALLTLSAAPFLMRDKPGGEPQDKASRRGGITMVPAVYLFGFMAFAGFISEGSVIDWSAVYLRKELSAGVEISGFAFAGFSFTMMLARFMGDHLRYRFGMRRLMDLSILASGTGLMLAAVAPNAPLAIAGFMMAGFGNANIVPLAFSSAASVKGVPEGIGIATATFCGYAGVLFAPALLGHMAEWTGFTFVFLLMALLVLSLLMLRGSVPHKAVTSGTA